MTDPVKIDRHGYVYFRDEEGHIRGGMQLEPWLRLRGRVFAPWTLSHIRADTEDAVVRVLHRAGLRLGWRDVLPAAWR